VEEVVSGIGTNVMFVSRDSSSGGQGKVGLCWVLTAARTIPLNGPITTVREYYSPARAPRVCVIRLETDPNPKLTFVTRQRCGIERTLFFASQLGIVDGKCKFDNLSEVRVPTFTLPQAFV